MHKNKLFAGRYFLKKRVGGGSFGDVWLANDNETGLDVALKIYIRVDEQGINDFREEFKMSFALNHANLLHSNYFSIYQNQPFLVMPYCEKGSLASYVGKIQDEIDVWKCIRDIAGGLEYLHGKDIVHRDIKPNNILLADNGLCMITDFGESETIKTTLRRLSTRNHSNKGGSIPYMAPERFEGASSVKASDIYALGVSLYELLEGKLPFEGNGGMMQLHGAEPPVLSSKWSTNLSELLLRCLAKEPWNRPTAHEIGKLAEQSLSHVTANKSQNKKEKIAKNPVERGKKRIEKVGIFVFAVLLVAMFSVCLALYWSKDTDKTIYQGELVNGLKHGWGNLCYSDSSIYVGNFRYDKCSGWGKRTYADGSVYIGQWEENERSGIGTYYVNGKIFCGIWQNDSIANENVVDNQNKTIYGIDVSKWQRSIDWELLAIPINKSKAYVSNGTFYHPVSFALIKATEGSDIIDAMFESNFENAKKYDVPRGAYHILSSFSPIEEQIENYKKTVKLFSGDFPPILDIEPTHIKNWDKNEVRLNALKWLKSVNEFYGVTPIIYTNENLYWEYLDIPEFKNFHFWIANLRTKPMANWTIWQFSHSAKIVGIGSDVKIDLNKFNGSYDDFQQFVKMYGIK